MIQSFIIEQVKNEVFNQLGVKNSFELNDKIDGVFYLKKQLKRVLSIFVIEKRFDIDLIDKSKILKSKTRFNIRGCSYEIIGIEIGDKIKIPNIDVDRFIIVGFFDNFRKNKILGVITKEKAIQYKYTLSKSNNIISKDLICSITEKELMTIDDSNSLMDLL